MKITKNGKDFKNYTNEDGAINIKENGVILDCGSYSIINCGSDSIINCGSYSIINCDSDNTINCNSVNTINCYFNNTIKSRGERNVVIRRDFFEIIELKKGQTIRLNGWGIKGYKIIEDKDKEVEKAIKLLENKGIIKNGKIIIN